MSITEVAYQVQDERQGILVAYGYGIDLPIILYWSEFPVLFLDIEEGGHIGQFGGSYISLFYLFS